jgi:putative solute:sodium symporter small subunit
MADRTTNVKAGARPKADKDAAGYWAANVRIIKFSLIIWAIVPFGFGILFRPLLQGIEIGGTDIGFWVAQQGSILVFLALIFFYAWRMNKVDRDYGVEED